jgi:hypothetical protein
VRRLIRAWFLIFLSSIVALLLVLLGLHPTEMQANSQTEASSLPTGGQSHPAAVELYASTFTLYDGLLQTTPDHQGWLFYSLIQATQVVSDGTTIFDTTADQDDFAGYMLRVGSGAFTQIPSLDRARGFTLNITVQVLTETHSTDKDGDGIDDRAGFSIIFLAEDTKGIELGFWPDEIWAQEDGDAEPPAGSLFTHAEGVAFDTMAALTTYQLTIITDTYTLAVGDTPILTGPVRDYTSFDRPWDFYELPNLLFLGDDTSQAKASIRLANVSVTVEPVPSNQPPSPPSNPTPLDAAAPITLTQTLAWQSSDPDDQPLTYVVAFGTDNPPPVVATTSRPVFSPTLQYDQTYYWQITATDGLSTTVGPVWYFTTVDQPALPKNFHLYLPLLLDNAGVLGRIGGHLR